MLNPQLSPKAKRRLEKEYNMAENLEIPADSTLNIEGKRNVPLCPMCTEELGGVDRNYDYKRTNPDTRWFYCKACECHLGYHRMKKKWKVDPYDLDTNGPVRAYFGLDAIDEPADEE